MGILEALAEKNVLLVVHGISGLWGIMAANFYFSGVSSALMATFNALSKSALFSSFPELAGPSAFEYNVLCLSKGRSN